MKIPLFIFCTFLIFLVSCTGKKDEKALATKKKPPVAVNYIVISPQSIENTIYSTGSLLANEQVEIRPEIAGRVTAIYFEEGSYVKTGTLLVKLNDSELQAQLKKARIQENLAKDDESRRRKLLDIKGISQEEYDISLNKLKTVQAEIELFLAQIEKTEIKAPFSGELGLRNISVGSNISSNTIVTVLRDIQTIKIEFSIPEKYSIFIKNGVKLKFSVSNNSSMYEASVYATEMGIDAQSRTIKVRAKTENTSKLLIPGSFAKIEIRLEKIENTFAIPGEAVIPDMTGQKVYMLKDGKVKPQKVECGIRTENMVQITDGISVNDTILTTGILLVKPGDKVKLAKQQETIK